MFKLNDCVKSKETGAIGIIQATYEGDVYLVFIGSGYEYRTSSELEYADEASCPFRFDLYKVMVAR